MQNAHILNDSGFGYNDLKIVENKIFLSFGGSTVFSAKPREKLLQIPKILPDSPKSE